MPAAQEIAAKILEIARRLHTRNCLAAADGNISYRVSDKEIWMTPTGVAKAFMNPAEMACVTLQNEIVSGNPSGERAMHSEIYRRCPEAKAIVHAHPPTVIAWMIAKPEAREIPTDSLPELLLAAGEVPIVPYALPGTDQMGTNLAPFLPAHKLLLLARHGAVAWGSDLEEAWRGIERVEHAAVILASAEHFGGAKPVPADEKKRLLELRKKIGNVLL